MPDRYRDSNPMRNRPAPIPGPDKPSCFECGEQVPVGTESEGFRPNRLQPLSAVTDAKVLALLHGKIDGFICGYCFGELERL